MRTRILRAAILAVLGISTLGYGSLEKHVTVRIEGVPIHVRTFASSVRDAVARAGVEVGPQDRVEPALSEGIGDGGVIEVYRAKEITLLLDGEPRTIVVTGLTVQEVLQEMELRGRLADTVRPSRSSPVTDGMTIHYRRAVDVSVRYDGRTVEVITNATRVGDVVRELGIKLGKRDRIEPKASAAPKPGMKIKVLRIGYRTEVLTEEIPYRTILRRDRMMEYGTRKVVQDGRRGLRKLTYRSRYVDGTRVSRRLLDTDVVRKPRTRIIAIGAGYPGCVCARGTQVGGASWYSQADGLSAAHRTLPFGTVVRVENLANGKWVNVVIRDRGPFIEGRIIDLSDEAFRRIAPLSQGVARVRIRW